MVSLKTKERKTKMKKSTKMKKEMEKFCEGTDLVELLKLVMNTRKNPEEVKMLKKYKAYVANNKLKTATKDYKLEVPTPIDYSLVSHLLEKKYKRGRLESTWMFKGKAYWFSNLCELFHQDKKLVYNRLYVLMWSASRAFGVDNHSKDHYISENLEMMITKVN